VRGGIDLGGTKIQAVVVDDDSKVLGEHRVPTPTEGGPADVSEAMAGALREAAEAADVETSELTGVGVGSPGAVNEDDGTVSSARNLPGWEGAFALGKDLGGRIGAAVKLGNDVQVATDAEFQLGAAREFDSVLGVFWGTGVGGGLVLDGKPWLGRGSAGEIGHVVVRRNGARCPCGRRGCMEAYAGRAAMEIEARREHEKGAKTDLFKIMEKRGRTRLTSGVWARALDRDDELATQLLDRAVEMLGTGIASAVNLLDVDAVVLGGGLGVRLGPRYLDAITKEMMKHIFVPERPPAMHVAALGDLGGAVGASLLVSNKR
jgi:glucokinase